MMVHWLLSLFRHPATLPIAVVLLELRRLRGIARYRDLTSGDTSSYFLDAIRWITDSQLNFAWSPIYSILSGMLLQQTGDPYATVLLVRVGSALLLAVAVGLLLRRCLSAGVALLVGAWWAFEPIAFDTLYEIHLFSAIGPVAALWMTLRFPSPAGRAATLALLTIWAFLQRNEYGVVVVLAGAIFVWRDVWRGRHWRPYVLAGVLSVLTVGLAYERSVMKYPELETAFAEKHTLNVCQIYAFGYQQRHPDWTPSPWTECSALMQEKFGMRLPTLWQAFLRNWRAMLVHFAWNLRLAPAGIQVLLFSQTSFSDNPDYAPVHKTDRAPYYSAAILALWLAGLLAAWKDDRFFNILRKEHWPSLLLSGSLVVSGLIVAATQRPRPSYLLALQVVLMLITGLALQAIVNRLSLRAWVDPAGLLVLLILLLAMPAYFTAERFPNRPLLTLYRRLEDHKAKLIGRKVLTPGYSGEICSYLATRPAPGCEGAFYYGLRDRIRAEGMQRVLETQGIQVVYVDAAVIGDDAVRAWLPRRSELGWVTIAEVGGPDPWVLVRKQE